MLGYYRVIFAINSCQTVALKNLEEILECINDVVGNEEDFIQDQYNKSNPTPQTHTDLIVGENDAVMKLTIELNAKAMCQLLLI